MERGYAVLQQLCSPNGGGPRAAAAGASCFGDESSPGGGAGEVAPLGGRPGDGQVDGRPVQTSTGP